jgi:hypothetical protein
MQAIWFWIGIICFTLGLSLAVGVPLEKHLREILILVLLSLGWTFLFYLSVPNEWREWPPTLAAAVAVLIYRRYYRKHHPETRL